MQCPYCAEDIKEEAIVCRHCGQNLALIQENERVREELSLLEKRVSSLEKQLSELTDHGLVGLLSLSRATKSQWSQIGLAVLLSAVISIAADPKISAVALSAVPEPLQRTLLSDSSFVLFFIAIFFVLPLGFWAGIVWPGRHLKGYLLLGLSAGFLEVAIAQTLWQLNANEILLRLVASTSMFVAGGLFADLWSWVWQDSPSPPRVPLRHRLVARAALIGALTFCVPLFLIKATVRMIWTDGLPPDVLYASGISQIVVAALIQATVAMVVMRRVAQLGGLHGFYAAFVAGCMMTVEIIGANLLFNLLFPQAFPQAEQAPEITAPLIWGVFSIVVTSGTLLTLPLLLGASMLAQWKHRLETQLTLEAGEGEISRAAPGPIFTEKVAVRFTGPGKRPSRTMLLFLQVMGPSMLTFLGTIAAAYIHE